MSPAWQMDSLLPSHHGAKNTGSVVYWRWGGETSLVISYKEAASNGFVINNF